MALHAPDDVRASRALRFRAFHRHPSISRCNPIAPLGVRLGRDARRVSMSGVGIIGAIIIGILAGFIAEKVMRRNHGLLTNLIVGVVGAFLGSFIATSLGIGTGSGVIP